MRLLAGPGAENGLEWVQPRGLDKFTRRGKMQNHSIGNTACRTWLNAVDMKIDRHFDNYTYIDQERHPLLKHSSLEMHFFFKGGTNTAAPSSITTNSYRKDWYW